MVPRYPDIPGLDQFQGLIVHSRDFRTGDVFQDKVVLIVGAGPSGVDIAPIVGTCATKVRQP